jgi:glutamate/tyrosine decarboxylase-like PLP-dependent enzyme
MKIPERGLSRDAVFERLEAYREDDTPWREGRTWAYVYDPGPEAESVIHDAFGSYLGENGLDPTAFPSALRMENEVVAMSAHHLHGDENVVGSFTSGGTESLICAVKAARDWAREKRPHIDLPEMVLAETAHASFHKAAHYLGLKPVVTRVDPVSYRADVDAVRDAITPNTVLLVGSAISYAHGVVDPIRELGQLALERDLLLHVDGCMGGFLLPYFAQLGSPVPDYDFRVPGVTSISMDLHKYAFAAKGASVILYRDKALRKYQMYACSNWMGYTVINPTVQSTKSAGPIAGAWAALNFIGEDGYLDFTRKVRDATQEIVAAIDANPDLRLLGRPDMNLLSFASPENLHLSINPASVHWTDAMLADLHECTEKAKSLPSGQLAPKIQQAFGHLKPEELGDDVFEGLLAMAGVSGTSLPGRMAEINEVLNALPIPLRERLLVEYLNVLYKS